MGSSRVILTTFAGRRDRMSLLLGYAVAALRRGVISEYHVWDYARNATDQRWISTLPRLGPGILVHRPSGPRYDAYYDHYREPEYGDAVFIKADDDIVFIDLEQLPAFIAYRRFDTETFLLSANIVNNGVCAFHQQAHGAVPRSLMELPYPPGGFCGALWESAQLATRLHRHFLASPALFPRPGTTIAPDRISINFIGYLGRDLRHLNGLRGDDEQALSVTIPQRLGRVNRIFNPLVVSHLSFYSQDPGMGIAPLITGYRDLYLRTSGENSLPGEILEAVPAKPLITRRGGDAGTAALLMTHRFDAPILEEFQRIREGLGAADRAFLLSDGSAPTPAAVAPWTHTFDYPRISRRAARVIGEDILRNIHLAWIDFFEAHPGFENYWFIEYDVRYSGSWSELFDAFRDLPHDLLCTHLRPFALEPGWAWWSAIQAPGPPLPAAGRLRGFLPVARLSRRGLERLRDAVDEGWGGFLEGLIPTLFQVSGLQIGDIGGDGPFVPSGFENRFYTSVSDPAGSLQSLGTMRFRPPILFPGIMPGRLYHPVKQEPGTLEAGGHQPRHACAALGRALRTIREQILPAQDPPCRAEALADSLLQVFTGLRSTEVREALDRMAAAGVEDLPLEALRRELLALPSFLEATRRITRMPAGGCGAEPRNAS